MIRAALLTIFLLVGCAPKASTPTESKTEDDRAICCRECIDGAATDPQGRDLSLLDCVEYATTDRCRTWLTEHPTFVQDCR